MAEDTGQDTDEQQGADDQQGAQDAAGGASGAGETPDPKEDFAAWLEAQGEDAQAAYEQNIGGLKSALEKEREAAKETSRELRDAVAKLEGVEGADEIRAEFESKLEAAEAQRDAAARKAAFIVDAVREGVADPELAWKAAADNDEVLDRHGEVDFAALKAKHPALFREEKQPRGNAGAGTGSTSGDTPPDMNDTIRRLARGG